MELLFGSHPDEVVRTEDIRISFDVLEMKPESSDSSGLDVKKKERVKLERCCAGLQA